PGLTHGNVEYRCPGVAARKMSMRDWTVPKSLDVQRTKAKMLPGAKDRTRRLRSTTCSETGRPNRTRFSIRFSSHKISTVVRFSVTMSLLAVGDTPGVESGWIVVFGTELKADCRERGSLDCRVGGLPFGQIRSLHTVLARAMPPIAY